MAWPSPGVSYLLNDWLRVMTNFAGTFTNSAISGRDPYNTLFRYDADVKAYSPTLFVIDALNNTGCAPYALEALIRKLWTDTPNCRIVFMCFNTYPNTTDAAVDAPTGDALITTQKTIAAQYGIPAIDVSAEYKTRVKASTNHLSDLIIDTVHPSNLGHQVAFDLLSPTLTSSFLSTQQKPVSMPARVYADSVYFENAPQTMNGTAYTSKTGVWSEVAGTLSSNSAGATVTYTVTGISIARPEGDGTVTITCDGSAVSSVFGANGIKLPSYGAHTIVITVVSGTVTISKLWVI